MERRRTSFEPSRSSLGTSPIFVCRHGACLSKLDSGLERDHARRTVSAEAYTEQPSGGRNGAFEGAELGWDVFARDPCFDDARQREVRVVESVEHLHVEAH